MSDLGARFAGAGFVCLEREGSESYPSSHKAGLFFEVSDLRAAADAVGHDRLVRSEAHWAVLHDPEGHNILFLEAEGNRSAAER